MAVHTPFEIRLAVKLWPALASLLAAGCATEGPTCTSETREIGYCEVEYGTCEDWRGNWTSTARDVTESSIGQSGESGEFRSQQEAEAQATFELFRELDSCNCEEESIPYGRCTLIARGCFSFESGEAFTKEVAEYRMRITDKATGIFGTAAHYSKPQDAFNPALDDLGTKMDLKACTI